MEPSTRAELSDSSPSSQANDDFGASMPESKAEAESPTDAISSNVASNETRTQDDDSSSESIAASVSIPPKAEAIDEGDPETFWMRWSDQLIVGTIMLIALVLGTVHYIRLSGFGRFEVEISRQPAREYDLQIDINSATWVEFAQLNGIGPTLARRIVDDREKNGPFQSIDELQRVSGIGPKRVKSMRPFLNASNTAH